MENGQDGIPLAEAAERLGLKIEAIRKRVRRGSLTSYKASDGRWFVVLPDGQDGIDAADREGQETGQDSGQDAGQDTVRRILQDEVAYLRAQFAERDAFYRAQLDVREREVRELHIMLGQAQRLLSAGVSPGTEVSREEVDAPRAGTERVPRGFWQRLFGSW